MVLQVFDISAVAKAVASLLAGVVLFVEQCFSDTVLRATCNFQTSFVRLLAVFPQHL